MKKTLIAALMAAMPILASAADVGVTLTVGQPGFYGRLDIGNVQIPQPPQLIFPAPVIVQPYPVAEIREPIYLRVPPGHEKKWTKHCRRYNACGQPVYFVRSGWYRDVYVPYYQRSHRNGQYDENQYQQNSKGYGHGHGNGNGKDKGKGKGKKNKSKDDD
jgi:hypothetical protein